MIDLQQLRSSLEVRIRARYPILYLLTSEEKRVEAMLGALARSLKKDLVHWSCHSGLLLPSGVMPVENSEDPLVALRALEKLKGDHLILMKDLPAFFGEPRVVRGLKELGQDLKSQQTTLIITYPKLEVPAEIEKEVAVFDVPLPTRAELNQMLLDVVHVVTRKKNVDVTLNRSDIEALLNAALGLTNSEAENVFAHAIARDGQLGPHDLELFIEEKKQVVRKGGYLEFFPAEGALRDVGGLSRLKDWLIKRKEGFSESAREFGLPEPRGVLLIGVQGCGKSLTAKTVAAAWRLPLLRLDMGRIYSGLIGSSEENIRKALKMAETLAPVVLWVDEIEKGIAGATSDHADSGVSSRVFGTLLTWMQEKTAPVFIVATSNRIESMPPELLRKGRFDEIFFVDLPDERERIEIFDIQIRKHVRFSEEIKIPALVAMTQNFSGAEIEQAIIAGMYEAFNEKKPLKQTHLELAISQTTPLAVTMRESISSLREWAKNRTRPAS